MLKRSFTDNYLKLANEEKHRYVEVSFEIINIGEINTIKENYDAKFVVEATWKSDDSNLEKYDPKTHWNPKLYIENALAIKEESASYKIDPPSEPGGDCYITEIRQIKGSFFEKFELKDVLLFQIRI